MMTAVTTNMKNGLKNLGYVKNLSTCKEELIVLLPDGETISCEEINAAAETPMFLNKHGYTQGKDGMPVTIEKAKYACFSVGRKNKDGEELFGVFEKNPKYDQFQGVRWMRMKDLRCKARRSRLFNIGNLHCEKLEDGLKFLNELATATIPEPWAFKNRPEEKINYPILKSYVENIFERLLHERAAGADNKILLSKDCKRILFDSNLLDKFSHEILITADVIEDLDGETLYMNPTLVRNRRGLIQMGFSKNASPEPPQFFKKVEEVIFQPEWTIDQDFEKFEHIVNERRERFPEDMRHESPEVLARKLDEGINFAVAIARRNYKFIVPMYRPQTNNIQLLMPIYLKGTYNSKPDFALILTPDKQNEIYTPETILPLNAVYQNARLIAKPDEAWLNPDTIL